MYSFDGTCHPPYIKAFRASTRWCATLPTVAPMIMHPVGQHRRHGGKPAQTLASRFTTNTAGSYWVPGWWEEVWVACLQGLYDSRRGRRELATLREDPPIWWYRIWLTSRH